MTEAKSLLAALVVPDYRFSEDPESPKHMQLDRLLDACEQRLVDLVVFPEAYYPAEEGERWEDIVEDVANQFGVPVFLGIETADGFQLACYCNLEPFDDETKRHVYVKHSSARKLAYEWPGYRGRHDAMFEPIRLFGQNVGVQICHDKFFGLVGQRLIDNGAAHIVDLTGGDVNLSKWTNVIHGRSLEVDGAYVCTMGYSGRNKGKACALAYKNGRPMKAFLNETGKGGYGGFVVFDLVGEDTNSADSDDQPYSDKIYRDITVSLGTAARADIKVAMEAGLWTINGTKVNPEKPAWLQVRAEISSVGAAGFANWFTTPVMCTSLNIRFVDTELVRLFAEKLPLHLFKVAIRRASLPKRRQNFVATNAFVVFIIGCTATNAARRTG